MVLEHLAIEYLKARLDNLDISLSSFRDALRGADARTLTDVYNIGSSIYARLDVALSTRASESTLSTFSGKFPSAVALGDTLANPTTTLVGSALLGWDGTYWRRLVTDTGGRLRINAEVVANPSNLDVALSTRASEATLAAIKAQTDKFTFDAANRLAIQNPPNLDVALSSRASESTLAGIKAQTDKFTFDAAGRLAIQNPPSLDVALSTRASESTLSALSGKFPSAAALGDALGNPTTTVIGSALLGFDGTSWGRVAVRALDVVGAVGRALAIVDFLTPSRQPYMVEGISVGTTEGSTAIADPGAKVLIIKNKGNADALIGINASVPTTNPLKVRAWTVKVIPFAGATAVYYKTAAGSTTIDIEWYN